MSETSVKRVLVYTPWFPTPDAPFEYTFVRQQVEILDKYLNSIDKSVSWEFVVWHEVQPTDYINKIVRGKRKIRFQWEINERIKVFFNRGCIASHRIPFDQSFLLRKGQKKVWKQIVKHLDGKPNLVWTITLSGSISWYSFANYIGISLPFMLQEHSVPLTMHLKRSYKIKLAQKVLNEIKSVVVVADRQIPEFKALNNKVEIKRIWNCASEVFMQPLSANSDEFSGKLLYVGRLSKQKGVERLLTAIAYLLDKPTYNITLAVVGFGDQYEYLNGLANSMGIDKYVEFVGSKNEHEIIEYLDKADVYILPSFYENCPVSLIEAQLRGVPCIATQNDANEYILLKENGIVVDEQGDGKSIAEAISELIKDYGAYNKDRIRIRAVEEFSPMKFSERFLGVFNDAMR